MNTRNSAFNLLIVTAVLTILVTTACGKASDSAFAAYKSEFNTDAKRFGSKANADATAINFGEVGAGHCAECHDGAITVNSVCWDNQSETGRKIELYHELGHCVLGLAHVATVDIMYPSRLSDDMFNMMPETYLSHLFKGE